MSDNEKTRKKLVESIRMTKAGKTAPQAKGGTAAPAETAEAPKTTRRGGKKAVAKKATAKKATAKKAAAKKPVAKKKVAARAGAGEEKGAGTADRFQSGRRVWPD